MADISEMRQSLEDRLKSLKSKIAEAKMPLKMFQMNGEQLKVERQGKLSKQDKTINYTTDQLEKYRKQAKHLEEELERRILSSQEQILLHQKEEHDSWLAAQMTEIKLNGLKKENAKYRHKLTDTEIKFKCLHKDPSAVHVPNTGFGREHYANVTNMRRGTPFPPPPSGTLFGVSPHHIPPSDFPGPPHPPFAVRNAYPLRGWDPLAGQESLADVPASREPCTIAGKLLCVLDHGSPPGHLVHSLFVGQVHVVLSVLCSQHPGSPVQHLFLLEFTIDWKKQLRVSAGYWKNASGFDCECASPIGSEGKRV
ncbi:Melanoma inhibitory activity protein 2 [Plecturocebus cupreus]